MDRRHRAVMAGVHRLEHVDHLLAAGLADDDAVGAHPERVAQAITLADRALALDVGGAALHPADMDLLELELRGVLDGQHPLGGVDEAGEGVERRGLARPGAARDDHVQASRDRGLEIGRHVLREGAEGDQILDAELLLLELADRDEAAVDRDGGHHRVEAAAVLQPRVDIGVALVDAAADRADDLVDDAQQVLLVLEGHVRERQLSGPLDEDAVRAVDQDVVDVVVLQQRLERAQAGDLVVELGGERGALLAAQDDVHLAQRLGGDVGDLGAQVLLGRGLERGEVELVQQAPVEVELELAETLPAALVLVRRGRARVDTGRGRRGLAPRRLGARCLARRRIRRGGRRGAGGRGVLAIALEHRAVPSGVRRPTGPPPRWCRGSGRRGARSRGAAGSSVRIGRACVPRRPPAPRPCRHRAGRARSSRRGSRPAAWRGRARPGPCGPAPGSARSGASGTAGRPP